MGDTPRHRLWRGTGVLTGVLLLAWLGVSVLAPWFARDLNAWSVGGFPVGYWLVGQGALLAYLLIIVVYVVRMEQIEARYRRKSADPARDDADTAAAAARGAPAP